jgi:hypothetical protein
VAFLATASRRAASGNNDRLSTPWREVISLAGVEGQSPEHGCTETLGAATDTRITVVRLQFHDEAS